MNSFIKPDSAVRIYLSSSTDILNNESFESISNAEVTLYENDLLIGKLDQFDTIDSQGYPYIYYEIQHYPIAGMQYRLEVSAMGFESILAETYIPEESNWDFKLHSSYSESDHRLEYVLELKDDVGEDYYSFSGKYHSDDGLLKLFMATDDPFFDPVNQWSLSEFVVSDTRFNENKHRFIFTAYYTLTETEFLDITFSVKNVSEDYHKYFYTQQLYNWSKRNPFAEPVKVYGNVINGYGIFAGFSEKETHTIIGLN